MRELCTPLMLISVDCLALYMDDSEFQTCIGKTVAVNCNARVAPLGCRMVFQTNSTASTYTTSEFVAIEQSAKIGRAHV